MTAPPAPGTPTPADAASGLERYLLRGPLRVAGQLQRMIDQRCTLTAAADGASPQAPGVLTAPLAVTQDCLWVDVPRSAAILRQLLAAPRLSFTGSMDKVDVRFACGPAKLVQHDGRAAMLLPLPERLLYLQRRELMRLEPPAGALHCLVPAPGDAEDRSPRAASIRDIGGGGLAILVPEKSMALKVGDVLRGCEIELPDQGAVEVDLRVRHVRDAPRAHGRVQQAGCEFIDLPQTTQSKLFRYLMQLDRARVARR